MIKFSYILVSRNDTYCGNSILRLTNTLNFLGDLLNSQGLMGESECVLVDWGSLETPLYKTLKLNSFAKQITKFIIVPHGIASSYNQDSNFSEVHAMNCGFRNMSGNYFLRIDQDTLVGPKFINWLNTSKDLPKVAFSGRRDLTEDQSLHFKKFILEEENLNLAKVLHSQHAYNNIIKDKIFPFWGSAVGVMMVEKEEYEKENGFNEELIYMNQMDVEFINRLSLKNKIYNLGLKTNFDFYHQYHETITRKYRITNSILYRRNLFKNNNDENWGLKQEKLEIYKF